MLRIDILKDWLHRDLTARDKILLTLCSFEDPVSISEIKIRASEAGFRVSNKWNISDLLCRSNGLAIRLPAGWELTERGRNHLSTLGVPIANSASVKIAGDLRRHLSLIQNSITRSFVEEAIKCYEANLLRSAVVMSWIAAVDVLYREVVRSHLAAFNVEAKRVDAKWKTAINEDGLARMGEADFLDRLSSIGVLGKSVKDELSKALKLRNGCGHPNSLKIGQNTVASHIEILILNVFEKFST